MYQLWKKIKEIANICYWCIDFLYFVQSKYRKNITFAHSINPTSLISLAFSSPGLIPGLSFNLINFLYFSLVCCIFSFCYIKSNQILALVHCEQITLWSPIQLRDFFFQAIIYWSTQFFLEIEIEYRENWFDYSKLCVLCEISCPQSHVR